MMGEDNRGLLQRLADAVAEINTVAKDGYNDHHGYAYATEAGVKRALRGALGRHGLVVAGVQMDAGNSTPTSAVVKVRICIGLASDDKSAGVAFEGVACDQDKSGKAVMKAVAGAVKYALTTMGLVPTGDDPEANREADELAQEGKGTKARTKRAAGADDGADW
jgi:hypothetical protein